MFQVLCCLSCFIIRCDCYHVWRRIYKVAYKNSGRYLLEDQKIGPTDIGVLFFCVRLKSARKSFVGDCVLLCIRVNTVQRKKYSRGYVHLRVWFWEGREVCIGRLACLISGCVLSV